MINQNKNENQYYLKEFKLFDGEYDITFNIVDVNFDKNTIVIAITKAGKITVREFDLLLSNDGDLYFEYEPLNAQIDVNDFETVEED